MTDWSNVVGLWRGVVGDAHVLDDRESLADAARSTMGVSRRIPAIVRPASRDEVQEVLRIAVRQRARVHPTSRGKNWGLGSRLPAAHDCALLDMSRMAQIVDFDERLAHVTVEPGVTFGQLYQFLQQRGSRLFANTTGAGPEASVIGNALERGDGAGPYGDRFAHVCALEVVLPTGECIHTGFDRFAETPLAPLHRWGVGPSLDGLFSQSNLGVVTRMTLWLHPLPRSLGAVRFDIVDPARLGPLVDALQRLRLDGTLRSAIGIWNDYRVISVRGGYPWEQVRGRAPLGRDFIDGVKHEWGGSTWFGLAALYAPSEEVGRALGAHVEATLRPVADRVQIDQRAGDPVSGAELFLEDDPGFKFLQGIPHVESLRSVYWRKKTAAPEDPDPDRDRCGVLWVCPNIPFAGDDARRAVAIAEQVTPAHGFEPLIAMVAQSERTIYFVPLVIYDRDVEGADDAAMACHDELLGRYVAAGYLPHRLGVQSMDSLPSPRDDSGSLAARLKRALDPEDVLAPGRYDFRRSWPDGAD